MIKLKKILLTEQKTKEEILIDYIAELIRGTKFENKTFVAGGYVRDMVMGKKSKDVDITVALPNGGIEIADFLTKKTNSYKEGSNPTIFPTFGTAKFNLRKTSKDGIDLSDINIEAVMTRKEQYKEGDRKPETSYGTINQDVERRDLTINSLLYDISNKKILDLTGKGINDIKNKVIRTPIDADIIFKEDPLRMLRAIRFSVKFGWKLSDDMLKSLKKNARMLDNISKERIQEELDKILLSDYPDDGIRMLMDTELMKYIIPEYYELVGMEQNDYHQWDAYEHSLRVLKNSPPKLEVRLGALLHDLGKTKTKTDKDGKIHFYGHEFKSSDMVDEILRRLKYSNPVINKVKEIVKYHMRTKSYGKEAELVSDKALRKLVRDIKEHLEDLLELVHADNISHGDIGWSHNLEKQVDAIRVRLRALGDFKIPINGDGIMRILNIKPSELVGDIKEKFVDIFFENPEKISKMSDVEIEAIIRNIYETTVKKEQYIRLKNLI